MSRKIEVTQEERKQIETLAGYGLTWAQISNVLGKKERTLRKLCKEEFNKGADKGKAAIAQSAFKMATSMKHPALTIFLCKTRLGWRESFDLDTGEGPIKFVMERGPSRKSKQNA